MLWRRSFHVADVDRLAPFEIFHLSPTEPRGPNRSDVPVVTDHDFIARPDLVGRIDDAHREDIAFGQEILDLDPIRIRLRKDVASFQRQREEAPLRVHGNLLAIPDDADRWETTAERRPLDQPAAVLSELEAGDVRHLLGKPRALPDRLRRTRDLIQGPR
jgi:hypothetical protein